MSISIVTTFFLLLNIANSISCLQNLTTYNSTTSTLQIAQTNLLKAKNWVQISSIEPQHGSMDRDHNVGLAWRDCTKLYDESEPRLARLICSEIGDTVDDALAWLSGVIANHRSCLEGLADKGFMEAQSHVVPQNLTASLEEALALYANIKKVMSKYI